MTRDLVWWDMWFLGLAKYISTASKDPSTKVGAVITDENHRIISTGYNGFPIGIKDDKRLNSREEKYKIIVHAEMNAVLFASRDISGCHIYTYPFLPCSCCAGAIIQSGIKRVVSFKNENPRWISDFEVSKSIFNEAGVDCYEYHPK